MPPYCDEMFTYSTLILYKSQQLNHLCFRCGCGCCSNEFIIEAKECRCGTEVPKCVDALTRANSEQLCITNRPVFNDICLNRWSLELASDNFRTRGGMKYRQVDSKDRSVFLFKCVIIFEQAFYPWPTCTPIFISFHNVSLCHYAIVWVVHCMGGCVVLK